MRHAGPLLAAGLLTLVSCSPGQEAASTDSDSTYASNRPAREQGEGELATRLDAVRGELDSLRRDAAALGPRLTATVGAGVTAVEARKDSAQARLERLRTVGEADWRDMREGVAVMLDSLEVQIDRLRRNLHSTS